MAMVKNGLATNYSGTPSELQSTLAGVPEIEQTGNREIYFYGVVIRSFARYILNRFKYFDFPLFLIIYMYIFIENS